jgi:hypothetical protein
MDTPTTAMEKDNQRKLRMCGNKRRFGTRATAESVIRSLQAEGLLEPLGPGLEYQVYECEYCTWIHFGRHTKEIQ